jgi:tetratricopeptide (TPR) repeat protein
MTPVAKPGAGPCWGFICGLLLLCGLPSAWAGSQAAGGREQRDAAKRQAALKSAAGAATLLASHRYAKAYRELAAAYRSYPNPETLFLLGQLAAAEGRTTEAQDLLRRYLADPQIDASAAHYQEAKQQAERPRGRSGELNVVGDQGAILLLDGRIVGVLPLAQPLLLAPGRHQVSLESDGKTLKGEVSLPGGRGAEMRFSEESSAVLLTLPPALLVLADWAEAPAALRPTVEQSIERAARGSGLLVYSSESALAEAALPASQDPLVCWERETCRTQILSGPGVEHALRVQIKSPSGGSNPSLSLTLTLFEAAVDDEAARLVVSCDSCTREQLQSKLAAGLDKLLARGIGRPRGQVEIASTPSGAEVHLGGRRLGITPVTRTLFAGVYDPELSLPGYLPQPLRVVVGDGKLAKYLVSLESEPEPEPEPLLEGPGGKLRRERRPQWRLQAGGSLLGIGGGLVLLGAWPLALDGTCQRPPVPPSDVCTNFYETRSPGLALAVTGGTLAITGAILLLIPGKRIRSARLLP